MNKKHALVAIILLGMFTMSLYTYWFVHGQSDTLEIDWGESAEVHNVSWNVLLAKAEFKFTVNSVSRSRGVIILDRVEVNGTKVDAYPQKPSLKLRESVLITVYYGFDYNSTYEFKFITEWEYIYEIVLTSPSQ
jgi:hypothetical protein